MKIPSVLKIVDYRRLFVAGLVSELGSYITDTALMLFLFKISGQNQSFLGASKAIFLASITLGGIFGGPLGDRYNRKKILMLCEWSRFPFVLSLIYFQNPYWLIAVNGIVGLFTGIFNPARQALINSIVPKNQMAQANGLFGSSMALLHMIGPLLGGLALTMFGGIKQVVGLDVLSYILGLALLSRIKIPVKEVSAGLNKAKSNYLSDLLQGIKHVKKRPDLTQLIMATFICGLSIGILIPMLAPFMQKHQGLDDFAFGLGISLFGLGGLLGGMLANRLNKKIPTLRIVVLGLLAEPIMMILWLNFPWPKLSLALFVPWGVIVFARFSSILTHFSLTVENDLMARVHSLSDLAFVTPSIAGGLIVAFLPSSISSYQVLMATALFFFGALAILGLLGHLSNLWNYLYPEEKNLKGTA